MNVQEARKKIVEIAQSYVGIDESSLAFKKLIDQYNEDKPLPRGTKMLYDWEWCACFVSSVFIQAGMQAAIAKEISTYYMLEGFKKIGRWVEDDAYEPEPADIIMYSWKDDGKGDNKLPPDHVGIVEKKVSRAGKVYIVVIEGNKGKKCDRREIQLNGRYIRGYCIPNFEAIEGIYKPKETKESYYLYHDISDIPSWARPSVEKAIAKKVIDAYDGEHFNIWETNLQTIVWLDRLGLLD